MRTNITAQLGAYNINFNEVVGYVARDRMLNDAMMDFTGRTICDSTINVRYLSTMAFCPHSPSSPATKISECEYLLLTVHLGTLHWDVIIVVPVID